ncbi:hypothetical protein MMPV_004403 [Pyropia vietnamensis]
MADPSSLPAFSTGGGSPSYRAVVVGATGAVGLAVVRRLLATPRCAAVYALTRRPLEGVGPSPRLHTLPVSLLQRPPGGGGGGGTTNDGAAAAAAGTTEGATAAEFPAADAAFCCVGTTIKAAGSQAAFRAVDHDMAVAFASHFLGTPLPQQTTGSVADGGAPSGTLGPLITTGRRYLGLVSAYGASPSAMGFYSRVKGETEASLSAAAAAVTPVPASMAIYRPPLLLTPGGTRDAGGLGGVNGRPAERAAQAVARFLHAPPMVAVRVEDVAAAMVADAEAVLLGAGGSPPPNTTAGGVLLRTGPAIVATAREASAGNA